MRLALRAGDDEDARRREGGGPFLFADEHEVDRAREGCAGAISIETPTSNNAVFKSVKGESAATRASQGSIEEPPFSASAVERSRTRTPGGTSPFESFVESRPLTKTSSRASGMRIGPRPQRLLREDRIGRHAGRRNPRRRRDGPDVREPPGLVLRAGEAELEKTVEGRLPALGEPGGFRATLADSLGEGVAVGGRPGVSGDGFHRQAVTPAALAGSFSSHA